MLKIEDIQNTLSMAIAKMKEEVNEQGVLTPDDPTCSETFLFVFKAMKDLSDHIAELEKKK